MSRAHSWVQFSQWVQDGCSVVPAAAAQAQVQAQGTLFTEVEHPDKR
jgi:hypothetical protein